jgi:hypothetical protein
MTVLAEEQDRVWAFVTVEDRMIEAAALWRRAPGGGASPFATDGPWHLIKAEAGDYDARGGDLSQVQLKPLPLARAEVDRMMEASGWIEAHVPERDRKLVCLVLVVKAQDRRPNWLRLLAVLGLGHGAEGLRKRYSRAITAVAKALTAARVPVVMARL